MLDRDRERKQKAKEFAEYWKDKGYEKGESQPFWLSFLGDVLGVEHPEQFIKFESKVKLDHASFIDGIIPATHVLIEQKSVDKSLRAPVIQSDGTPLNPFQQAKRYSSELPYSERPRWIITCNFHEFLIYDMEKPTGEPESILLEELPKEYYRFRFITETGSELLQREMEISIKAGEIVGQLYDEILKQYKNQNSEQTLKSLNMLCVRIVFCLYAEDSGLFGGHSKFHDYMSHFDVKHTRNALIELFRVLDTKPEDRDPYLDEELASFPYVNGGLFADENIEIPNFNETILNLLLKKASEDFDWSEISPTIFGAVFESTLTPETRRSGGMHYTSIENIHKVIDQLFLNELKEELDEIKQISVPRTRNNKLEEYRNKLASQTFLDPACGSGNFLTETYISLRKLENEALKMIYGEQIAFETGNIIRVSIGQFYGIEINDFAVTVAKTALWIAESQMMKATEEIVKVNLDFLPLKSYANIVEGNALTTDWETVVPKEDLNYIMGNPPFIGYSLQTKEQKEDILSIYVDEKGKPYKTAGKVDYVAGWYFKAASLIYNTNIRVAFVSTNSITQGEQVAAVWKPLFDRFKIHIDFAHRTFQWDSEASIKAHVYCVVIGFNCSNIKNACRLFTSNKTINCNIINAYLIDAPIIFIDSRTKPICQAPNMVYGSKPTDDGNFFLTEKEYLETIDIEPNIKKYIRKFLGASEFINNKKRYCLWLENASPNEIKSSPFILDRIKKVKEFRLKSEKVATRESANTPTLFQEIRQSTSEYILVPAHTGGMRKYIPMGFENADVICGNANLAIPHANLYHFGVLNSNVHMAWTRTVCGYLGTSYRYSANIVYNNFPWCTPTEEQKAKIEQTAQDILDARALYPDSSLADLYDDITMPPELRKAHQENDRAVMKAYGFSTKMTESECVAELMKMYQSLVNKYN